MESNLSPKSLTFEVLAGRLIEHVKGRINNGEFTERGLARILGMSQSQIHNVLKGARSLQLRLADRILTKLTIPALDLFTEDELEAALLQAKMSDWDRQLAALELEGTPFGTLDLLDDLTPKKPAGKSGLSIDREPRRKTG